MHKEITEKERGFFNDLIIMAVLIFIYVVYAMINTDGFKVEFKPSAAPLISNVVMTFVLISFLMTSLLKKGIFWMTFIFGIVLLLINGLALTIGTLAFVLMYVLYYLYDKTKNNDYIILIILTFLTCIYTELAVFEPRMNKGAKLIGVFVNLGLILLLSKFLSKKKRLLVWGIGAIIITLLFLKVRMVI